MSSSKAKLPPAVLLMVASGIGLGLGGGIGWGVVLADLDLPLLLLCSLLGLIPVLAVCKILGQISGLPDGLVWPRVLKAVPFGVLLSLALFCFWWSFDPLWRISTFGAFTGMIAGVAMGITYGGLGGESRPMGRVEAKNLGVWLGIALVFAVFFASEEDPSLAPGLSVVLMLPGLLSGGRLCLVELFSRLPD